jgi:hypothetical protein
MEATSCALMADTQYGKLTPKSARPFLFSATLPTRTSAVFSTYAISGWPAGHCRQELPAIAILGGHTGS